MRLFANRFQRRIFGPKGEEVTEMSRIYTQSESNYGPYFVNIYCQYFDVGTDTDFVRTVAIILMQPHIDKRCLTFFTIFVRMLVNI